MKNLQILWLIIAYLMMIIFSSHAQENFDTGEQIRILGTVVQLVINGGEEYGSGFIISEDGLILTNAHVIANIDRVNPDIQVGIFQSTVALPEVLFKARPLSDSLINEALDVAVLEIYEFADSSPLEGISLSYISNWNREGVQVADPINAFGYPNASDGTITTAKGIITAYTFDNNYASDVFMGDGMSGGPVINNEGQLIGIIQARVAAYDDNPDYTIIISLDVICNNMVQVCDLLASQTEEVLDEPVVRQISSDESIQCLNAHGPNFEIGDRFVIPEGRNGTFVRKTSSWVIDNIELTMQEGNGGTIIQGPVCAPGIKGELIGYFVETDDGVTGWMAEGYIFNVIPWIVKESDLETWADYAPEGFFCDTYGPNLQLGDEFIVPPGDGPTRLWQNPNRAPRGGLMPEGMTGIILEGPVCAGGNGGLLVSWRVLADDGQSGWASEGYNHSPVPWIAPIVAQD